MSVTRGLPAEAFRWRTVDADQGVAERLAERVGVPRAVGVSLVGRGLTNESAAGRFLNPRLSDLSDPFAMNGLRRAVEHIWSAVESGKRVVVYGDYDADGVTSAALLVLVLGRLGAGVCSVFLPNRLTEGYGFSVEGVHRCLREHAPELIVTADCGCTAVEAVAVAREAGVDVVVTDHHELADEAPACAALVNPKLDGDDAVLPLAGVGVVFKLCHGLVKYGMERDRCRVGDIDLRQWLDLVAVGTVADVVPLVGENRILVRHGLNALHETGCVGLRALSRAAGVRGRVDCYHVGFVLGPRMNAAGRLGSAEKALALLLTEDRSRAAELAAYLDRANEERRRIEADILLEARNQVSAYFDPAGDFGLVAGGDGWHEGVTGIVAARLSNEYYRPSVVVAFDDDGRGRGSCRSVEGVDLVEVLEGCGDLLEAFGGHKAAAGLSIRKVRYEEFRRRFNDVCAEKMGGRDVVPALDIDAWITLGEADQGLLEGIRQLRPFGTGNTCPIWGVRGVKMVGGARRVGKQKEHLKFLVGSGASQREAIAFGMGNREVPATGLDVAFSLEENEYMNRRTLQLNVKDFRPSL